jgi:hypothetical protein
MRIFLVALTALSVSFLTACCREQVPQPNRPTDVRGWKESRSGAVNYICSLVLHEGESSDNGKIGVNVISIIPPDLCAERDSFLGTARARLKFFSPSDGQVVCEVTVLDRANADLESSSYCGPNGMLKVISVSAINTKEKWIALSLTD